MNDKPEIYIHAINPGFTIDGQSNVGELIEIARMNPDNTTPILLAGIILSYTNSSGNTIDLLEFPEDSWMTGEIILLRLASSPESELADLTYAKTLAQKAGPLVLRKGEEILDSVCWTGKDDCAEPFKSSQPTILLHNFAKQIQDSANSEGPPEESSLDYKHEYIHLENYNPTFNPDNPGIIILKEDDENEVYAEELLHGPEEVSEAPANEAGAYETSEKSDKSEEINNSGGPNENDSMKEDDSCTRLQFSEILTYYESSQSEQFIEFYNPTSDQILLDNCQIKYKNKTYTLKGIVDPDDYYVRLVSDFSLTKNPSTKNTVELIDSTGKTATELTYYNGQKKSTSYAHVGYDESGKPLWRNTFMPTPGSENIYQQYKSCEEGKVLNEETGNCVKPTIMSETTCKEGYYLNLETGRCKKLVTAQTAEKTCKEGYYLNPLTNRCKKIVENSGADYPLNYQIDSEAVSGSEFVALSSIVVLAILTVGFILFELRREIKRIAQKVFHRLFHKKKDLKREN